jgi:hypothetical protein
MLYKFLQVRLFSWKTLTAKSKIYPDYFQGSAKSNDEKSNKDFSRQGEWIRPYTEYDG